MTNVFSALLWSYGILLPSRTSINAACVGTFRLYVATVRTPWLPTYAMSIVKWYGNACWTEKFHDST